MTETSKGSEESSTSKAVAAMASVARATEAEAVARATQAFEQAGYTRDRGYRLSVTYGHRDADEQRTADVDES